VWALVPLAGEVACASPATTTTRDTPVSGLATTHEFVKEGAFVFVTGRREAELAAAVNEIEGKAAVIRGDVSNSDDLDCLFSQIASEKGKLDVVFVAKNICTHLR
jgi:NAD(P)-dependent dehydrogenase (short-subunit alcohol dehydrogenase family)